MKKNEQQDYLVQDYSPINQAQNESFPKLDLASSLGKREVNKLKNNQPPSENSKDGKFEFKLRSLYSKEAMKTFFEQTKEERNNKYLIIPDNIRLSQSERFIFKRDWHILTLAFLVPMLIMLIIFALQGFYPLGNLSFIPLESSKQYLPFLAEYQEKIKNFSSLNYSFNGGLGYNFFNQYTYYLSSPFNFILFFFNRSNIYLGVFLITLLKISFAGLNFALFLRTSWCFTVVEQIERFFNNNYEKLLSDFQKKQSKYNLKENIHEKLAREFEHKNDQQNMTVLLCAVLYAVNSYIFTYLWQWIWLDALVFMPLVLLGIHRLVNLGKPLIYITFLSLSIFSQYYAGIFVMIFSFIYFVAYLFINTNGYTEKGQQTKKLLLLRICQYFISSFLAIALLAVFLLPIWYDLQHTAILQGKNLLASSMNNSSILISPLKLLETFFLSHPNLTNVLYPSLYASLLSFVAWGLYWACGGIRLSEKIILSVIQIFLLLSFTTEAFNQLWHALHIPSQLPYRFSFLFILVNLLILFRLISNLSNLNMSKALIATVFNVSILLSVYFFSLKKLPEISLIWLIINLVVIVFYSLFLILAGKKQISQNIISGVLVFLILSELMFSSFNIFSQIKNDNSFVKQSAIAEKETSILPLTKELAKIDTDLYRTEIYPEHSLNDPSLYQYKGISIFSSTIPHNQIQVFKKLGYKTNFINSLTNGQMSSLMDLLFGVKYHIRSVNLGNDLSLQKLYDENILEIEKQVKNSEVYERLYSAGLGFAIARTKDELSLKNESVFENHKDFVNYLMQENNDYYQAVQFEVDKEVGVSSKINRNLTFSTNGPEKMKGTFTIKALQDGQLYLYVNSLANLELTIERKQSSEPFLDPLSTNERTQDKENNLFESKLPLENKVIVENNAFLDLGYAKKNERLEVDFEVVGQVPFDYIAQTQNPQIIFFEAATQDLASYKTLGQRLSKNKLFVNNYTSDYIEGTINLQENQDLFLSIPVNEGFKFWADGRQITPEIIGNLFYRLQLEKGEHQITIRFRPTNYIQGLWISLLALFLIVLFVFFSHLTHKYILKIA